jgi:hypothetical protein
MTFVVGAQTRLRLAEQAVQTLQTGRPQSVSVVLNNLDCHRFYNARYYGRAYNYYADTSAAA